MGSVGIWQIVIIAVVVVLLFGRGKISELMGDVAKGIKSFKKGLNDDAVEDKEKDEDPKVINHAPGESVNAQEKTEDTAKKD